MSFDQFADNGIDAPSPEDVESSSTFTVSVSKAEIVELCRTDLDFFAQFILGDVYEYKYSDYHKAVWQLLCNEALKPVGKPKLALGIPRGFSKTVMAKLWFAWIVLFAGERNFLVTVCNTSGLAVNFVSDVADMLDTDNVKTVFGDWRAAMEKDTEVLKKFSFRGRNIILGALGSGTSLRGLNVKFRRPDIILMDDMQNRDEAENVEVAKQLLIWMLGTLQKAAHPKKCVFVFIGNMYPFEGSILKKLKNNEQWVSFITGAILADGTSLWPEHKSLEDLLQELADDTAMGHPEIFYSEVMNDEEGGTVSGLDLSKIPLCSPSLDTVIAQGGFVIVDPSLGKKKSDDIAIGAFLLYDAVPVLRELRVGKFDPGTTIKEATSLAIKYNMQLIVVESVGYQETLAYWFDIVWQQLGITGITVGTVTTGGMQKVARIREMFKKLLTGQLLLHANTRSAVLYQAAQFNPMKPAQNKDDILDVCAYAHKTMAEYEYQLPLLLSVEVTDLDVEASHTYSLELAF